MNKFQKNLFNEVKHGYSTLCLRCQFQYFQWTWRVANDKYYLIFLTQPFCRNARLELTDFITKSFQNSSDRFRFVKAVANL